MSSVYRQINKLNKMSSYFFNFTILIGFYFPYYSSSSHSPNPDFSYLVWSENTHIRIHVESSIICFLGSCFFYFIDYIFLSDQAIAYTLLFILPNWLFLFNNSCSYLFCYTLFWHP